MRGDDDQPGLAVRLAVAAGGAALLLLPFAVLAGLVANRADGLREWDGRISAAAHEYALRHPAEVRFMEIWSLVFHPGVLRVAAVALVVWLLWRRRWPLALWVGVTVAAGGALGVVLKLLFGRHRPEFLEPVSRAPGYAFPSGHAMTAALIAAVALMVLLPLTRGRPVRRAALWAGAVTVPLITGLSRIGLGVHWTSDVLAGWLVGAALVATTAAAYQAIRRRRGGNIATEGLEPEVAARR